MNKMIKMSIVFIFGIILLTACNNQENISADEDKSLENEERLEDEGETIDDEVEDEVVIDEEFEEEPASTFEDELRFFEVETVTYNLEEVEVDLDITPVIEYETFLFIEADLITQLSDYELTYDPERNYAEVFKGKADFEHEPYYSAEEKGGILEVGETYLDESGTYPNNPGDDLTVPYNFVEYDGRLYVSSTYAHDMFLDTVHLNRREGTLEIGLRSEAESMPEYARQSHTERDLQVTSDSKYTTNQGNSYDEVVVIGLDSLNKGQFAIVGDHQVSKYEGAFYVRMEDGSDGDTPVTVTFEDPDENVLKSFEANVGDQTEVEINFDGHQFVRVKIESEIILSNQSGPKHEIIFAGDLR